MNIGIVDYVTGNIASLEMALADLDVASVPICSAEDLACVDAAILPGVGHFGPAAFSLEKSGLRKSLLSLIDQGFPVLGICLGFQMLTASSEEAPGVEGLGVLPGFTRRLSPLDSRIHKVPHVGWNFIREASDSSSPRLLHGIPVDQRLFYFANSYGVPSDSSSPSLHAFYRHESTWLGLVEQGSVFGVQFHPEKSRSQGLQVLRNFLVAAGMKG